MEGLEPYVQIFSFSDNLGIYVTGSTLAPETTVLCKYVFSIPGTASCQTLTGQAGPPVGQVLLSTNELFFLSQTNASPYDLLFQRIMFENTNVVWSDKVVCPGVP